MTESINQLFDAYDSRLIPVAAIIDERVPYATDSIMSQCGAAIYDGRKYRTPSRYMLASKMTECINQLFDSYNPRFPIAAIMPERVTYATNSIMSQRRYFKSFKINLICRL